MSNIEDHSNYVLSNMVNSLLELADGAAYHGHMDRLRRYNNRLVEFASMCPESENVVKWRPVLNVVMRGLVLAVQYVLIGVFSNTLHHNLELHSITHRYDDVDAAMDMLKIKSKIPEKGLRHNGLFSIFLDEDEERGKNGVDDDDVVVSAPPPLQLERDIVRSLLYLAARNGSSELAEEALNMFSQYVVFESLNRKNIQSRVLLSF